MMTPKLKRSLSTKILALVAASCALVTGSRAAHTPQTAGESNIKGSARYAQRRDTTLRASGILMGDKAVSAKLMSVNGGDARVK